MGSEGERPQIAPINADFLGFGTDGFTDEIS
jgi:hypothetical protein